MRVVLQALDCSLQVSAQPKMRPQWWFRLEAWQSTIIPCKGTHFRAFSLNWFTKVEIWLPQIKAFSGRRVIRAPDHIPCAFYPPGRKRCIDLPVFCVNIGKSQQNEPAYAPNSKRDCLLTTPQVATDHGKRHILTPAGTCKCHLVYCVWYSMSRLTNGRLWEWRSHPS